MRLKGTISHSGLNLLATCILPTLEKFGKHCVLLASPEMLHFIQKSLDTDGIQVIVSVPGEALFERYDCSSAHRNQIGIDIDISQLLRVLRSALTAAELVELRLRLIAERASGGVSAAEVAPKPYLCLTCPGDALNVQQDIPVNTPLRPSELDVLQAEVNASESDTCGYYLDIKPELPRLQAIIDKMKSVSSTLTVATTKVGDLHLQVESGGVHIACELRSLLPDSDTNAAAPLIASTAEGRLNEARLSGGASTVVVQAKHFQRSVQSSSVAAPERVLCGIDIYMGYVQFIFALSGDLDAAGNGVSMTIKLPVRAD